VFRPGWESIFRINQATLEQAVRRVSADPGLDQDRKAYLMQNIMASRYIVANQKRLMGLPSLPGPTYHNAALQQLGCEHYSRKCVPITPGPAHTLHSLLFATLVGERGGGGGRVGL
jgi:zinc finger protein-like protein